LRAFSLSFATSPRFKPPFDYQIIRARFAFLSVLFAAYSRFCLFAAHRRFADSQIREEWISLFFSVFLFVFFFFVFLLHVVPGEFFSSPSPFVSTIYKGIFVSPSALDRVGLPRGLRI